MTIPHDCILIGLMLFCTCLAGAWLYKVVDRYLDMALAVMEKRQNAFDKLLSEQLIAAERRQQSLDRQFAEQSHRLEARDREIDLLIADIPKRVDYQMQAAVAKYVQPYEETADTLNQRGVQAKQEVLDELILGQDNNELSLEEILERLETEGVRV